MLLRIDKVSGGNNPADPTPSSDEPLHVCLATATVQHDGNTAGGGGGSQTQGGGGSQIIRGVPHAIIPSSPVDPSVNNLNRSGEILTVGRKNCIVTIDDKCVSRGHATISLLSNRTLDDEDYLAATASSLLLDGRIMMEFGTPSNPEEVQACRTSPSGVICVVKDMGSKFGTYVSVDEGLLRQHNQPCNGNGTGAGGDDDETGDETDDENAAKSINFVELSEKQARAVHLLSANTDNAADSNNNNNDNDNNVSSLPKFQKLTPQQSIPLLQLSHSTASSPNVIILFGPQGSAVRLSLLPLKFTFSRYKKAELDPLYSCLHYIGAQHSAQWDVKGCTHLVASEKTAAAKGIMAYACRRPVVTKGYIEALLDRRNAEEGLPKEEDFTPSGTWDRSLKYTLEPASTLKGYRIAVMVDDDNAPLAQSAGADILLLHEHAPTSSHNDFDSWWTAQLQKALEEKLAMVVVSSTSRKCKRFHDWLKQNENVRFTNAKHIAKAITNNNGEGELLMDTKKVVIEKVEGWDGRVDDGGEKTEDEKDGQATKLTDASHATKATDATVKFANRPKEATKKATEKATAEIADRTMDDDVDFSGGNHDYDHEQEESHDQEIPVSPKRKRRQETDPADREAQQSEQEEEHQTDRQKRHRQNAEKDARAEEEALAEERAAAEKSTTKRNNKSSNNHRMRKDDDSGSDDEPGLPAERISLPTTEDGWMVAAPKKRKAYRKEFDVGGEDEDVPDTAAESEKVSGLIVRKYVPPKNNSSGNDGGTNAARAGNGKKKDFKRFRKNHVLRGYTSFNPRGSTSQQKDIQLPKIRLVDVQPKESERQRQLQQQQEDYEREQELADALFNDNGGPKSGRKRGGTMHAFLSQSTVKKGRGRR